MVQRYEQTGKLQWYKRGAAYPKGVITLLPLHPYSHELLR